MNSMLENETVKNLILDLEKRVQEQYEVRPISWTYF